MRSSGIRHILALLPLLFSLASAQAQQGSNSQMRSSDAALANEIIERLGAVPQRQNAFHETRTLSALTKPLESDGVLRWRAPDYLEKLTLKPRREDLVISGHEVMMTRGEGPTRLLDISGSEALRLLTDTLRAPLSGNVDLLVHHYRLSAINAGNGHWSLTLLPATTATARYVRKVVMRGQLNAITFLQIEQENGDIQTLVISL